LLQKGISIAIAINTTDTTTVQMKVNVLTIASDFNFTSIGKLQVIQLMKTVHSYIIYVC